jgi:hypothetical protein
LARSLSEFESQEEARRIRQDIFEEIKRDLPSTHFDLLEAKRDVSDSFHRCRQYDLALSLRKEIVKECEVMFSAEHKLNLLAKENIGRTLRKQWRSPEALDRQKEVFALRQQHLGSMHRSTSTSAGLSARVMMENRKTARETVKLQADALNTLCSLPDRNESDVSNTANTLADLYGNLNLDHWYDSSTAIGGICKDYRRNAPASEGTAPTYDSATATMYSVGTVQEIPEISPQFPGESTIRYGFHNSISYVFTSVIWLLGGETIRTTYERRTISMYILYRPGCYRHWKISKTYRFMGRYGMSYLRTTGTGSVMEIADRPVSAPSKLSGG